MTAKDIEIKIIIRDRETKDVRARFIMDEVDEASFDIDEDFELVNTDKGVKKVKLGNDILKFKAKGRIKDGIR